MLEKLARQLRACQKHTVEIAELRKEARELREEVRFLTNLVMLMPYGVRTGQPGVIPPRRLPRLSARHHVVPRPRTSKDTSDELA